VFSFVKTLKSLIYKLFADFAFCHIGLFFNDDSFKSYKQHFLKEIQYILNQGEAQNNENISTNTDKF